MIPKTSTKMKKGDNNSLVVTTEKIPIVYSYNSKQGNPKFGSTRNSVVITHSEFLFDVTTLAGSGTGFNSFTCAKANINAALPGPFPWLSSVARNFVNYKFRKLSFTFRPMSATTTPGVLMMVADPDPAQPNIENKVDFLNRKGATTGCPYKLFTYNCLVGDINKEKSYYARVGQLPTNSDIKLADCCAFFMAYQGTPVNTLIGELHVSYTVELSVPVMFVSRNQISNIETWTANGSGTVSNNFPLGNTFGVGNIVGEFLSKGWKYLTGGSLDHIFQSSKSIAKVIRIVGNIANLAIGGVAPALLQLLTYNGAGTNDPGLIQFTDEGSDLLTLSDTSPNLFTDVTTTYSTVNYLTLVPSTGLPANSYNVTYSIQNFPAGGIIKIVGNTASSNNPVTTGFISCTDLVGTVF
jgi:hypothetical protein